MTHSLVVVGGGNMGAALLGGLLAAGVFEAGEIAVVETSASRRAELAEQFRDITIADSPVAAVGAVIAVKPPEAPAAAGAAAMAGATRILSIAAGVTLDTLQAAVGGGVAVVRAMPNTPALVGLGASAIAGGATAGPDDLAWAERILGAVGIVERVAEADLDAVTALTGSGPAYLFLVAESLTDAGVGVGLERELAERMIVQLFVGSAGLLHKRGDPAALRAMVTSPGGTTAAGLAALDDRHVRDAFVAAVEAARDRSIELGRQ